MFSILSSCSFIFKHCCVIFHTMILRQYSLVVNIAKFHQGNGGLQIFLIICASCHTLHFIMVDLSSFYIQFHENSK